MRVGRVGSLLFEEIECPRVGPPLAGEVIGLGQTGLAHYLCLVLLGLQHGMGLAKELRTGIGVFEFLGGFEQFLAVGGPYFPVVFIHYLHLC